jgi:hypothetical protein
MKRVLIALLISANAEAVLVQTPKGTYDVEQSPNGFEVYGLSGQGIASVIRQPGGYAVQSPEGTTNIYMDGGDERMGLGISPADLSVTPYIPDLR